MRQCWPKNWSGVCKHVKVKLHTAQNIWLLLCKNARTGSRFRVQVWFKRPQVFLLTGFSSLRLVWKLSNKVWCRLCLLLLFWPHWLYKCCTKEIILVHWIQTCCRVHWNATQRHAAAVAMRRSDWSNPSILSLKCQSKSIGQVWGRECQRRKIKARLAEWITRTEDIQDLKPVSHVLRLSLQTKASPPSVIYKFNLACSVHFLFLFLFSFHSIDFFICIVLLS